MTIITFVPDRQYVYVCVCIIRVYIYNEYLFTFACVYSYIVSYLSESTTNYIICVYLFLFLQ